MGLKDQIRDKIGRAKDARQLPPEKVPVPEWDCDVWIRHLSSKERDKFEAARAGKKRGDAEQALRNVRAKLLVLCLVDDTGERLFEEHEAESLGDKASAVVDRLFEAARKLNRIFETAEEKEEQEKNSATTASAASSSA